MIDNSTMKTTTVTWWLRVENNSKFVWGRKPARENIERYHLRRSGMKKMNECEYELTFYYSDDTDLDQQIYGLLQEIEMEADLRYCFTEADVCEKGTDRSW